MSASGGKADVRFEQKPIFDSPLTARSGRSARLWIANYSNLAWQAGQTFTLLDATGFRHSGQTHLSAMRLPTSRKPNAIRLPSIAPIRPANSYPTNGINRPIACTRQPLPTTSPFFLGLISFLKLSADYQTCFNERPLWVISGPSG